MRAPLSPKLTSVLEFITMSLENGIVLPGITRDSIIQMLNDLGSRCANSKFILSGYSQGAMVAHLGIFIQTPPP